MYSRSIKLSIYSLIILGSALNMLMLFMMSVVRCTILYYFLVFMTCTALAWITNCLSLFICEDYFFSSSVGSVLVFLRGFWGMSTFRIEFDVNLRLTLIFSLSRKTGFLSCSLSKTWVVGLHSGLIQVSKRSVFKSVFFLISSHVTSACSLKRQRIEA